MKRILIAGSGSQIGQALITYWQDQGVEVVSIGRAASSEADQHLSINMAEAHGISVLQNWLQQGALVDAVISCYGFLHHTEHGPEKSLNEFDDAFFMQNMQINLLTHVHIAQALQPLLRRDTTLRFMCLSAMVGSITDNHLGGWYSYRMSKAALNMFIKTLAIEWQRKAPNTLVVATHPGTTSTPLSSPFQRHVAKDKLYTPTQTAHRLSQVLLNLRPNDHGHLLHWDGSKLAF